MQIRTNNTAIDVQIQQHQNICKLVQEIEFLTNFIQCASKQKKLRSQVEADYVTDWDCTQSQQLPNSILPTVRNDGQQIMFGLFKFAKIIITSTVNVMDGTDERMPEK